MIRWTDDASYIEYQGDRYAKYEDEQKRENVTLHSHYCPRYGGNGTCNTCQRTTPTKG